MRKIEKEDFIKLKQLDRIEFLLERDRLSKINDKNNYASVLIWSIYYFIIWFAYGFALVLLVFIAFKDINPTLVITFKSLYLGMSRIYLNLLIFIGVICFILQVIFYLKFKKEKEWLYNRFFNKKGGSHETKNNA